MCSPECVTTREDRICPIASCRTSLGITIDLVKVIDSTSDCIKELVDIIREWESGEGVVVRFEADAYLALHRSNDPISNEKSIIEVVLN